jgi:CRISPR-associated protein Cmr3
MVEGGPAALNDQSPRKEPRLLGDQGATEPLGGWLSPRGLLWALSGKTTGWQWGDHCADLPPFIRRDSLPGLAIDPETGTAEDGMLFFSHVLRFAGMSGIAGWLSAPLPSTIPANALTRGDLAACGWRSRPAVLEPLPALDPDWQYLMEGRHLPREVADGEHFYLTALTPIPCSPDAHLQAIERDICEHAGAPAGVEVHVHASLTGKPRVIGGLTAASRKTRPNRSYWEAGSAFFITLHGGTGSDRANALRRLNNAHPLGRREDASFGYGHTLVAVGEGKKGGT